MKSSKRSEAKASRKDKRSSDMGACPLVMIEWEDSAQPIPGWSYLSSFEPPSIVKCVSVGWLIHDGDDVKALAPNIADLTGESSVQVSGVIRIPTRCIVNVVSLQEPDLTSCASPDLSSRPGTGPTLRAT